MRTWSRLRSGAALLGVGALLGAAPVVPDPVLVEAVPDLPARLAIVPAVHQVDLRDDGVLVVHHIENGLAGEVVLGLDVTSAAAGPDGAPVPTEDPADGWRLPAGRVVLGPGERARVTSVATTPGVYRLAAAPGDGEPLVALVVVADTARPELDVATALTPDRAAVEVRSLGAPAVVEVRLRAGPALAPAPADQTVGPLVVMPDAPRQLTWDLDLPGIPWPQTVEVDVLVDDRTAASTSVRVWPSPAVGLVTLTLVLLGATAIRVALARRRRRRAG